MPWAAIAPNILIDKRFPDYPFLNGTGFFCRLPEGVRYYYVTALHCLDEGGRLKDMKEFPLLKVAYETSLKTHIVSDDVKFEGVISVAHGSENKSGAYEDILIYIVESGLTPQQEEILRHRALIIKNPTWYKKFFEHVEQKTRLRVIGYPKDSTTKTEILDGKAQTQRRFLWGFFSSEAHYQDRKAIEKLNWKGTELVGFSGAPVLAQNKRLLGIESIPVGVVLTGNSRRLEFLEMGRVADMILHLDRYGLYSKIPFRYSN
jgi:hypothetical protein